MISPVRRLCCRRCHRQKCCWPECHCCAIIPGDNGDGHDADWFRDALADREIKVGIPSKANRKIQIPYDRVLYRKRHKIGNMFGKLKDWRRIHTRCGRCGHTFLSAIAAIVRI